MIVSIAIMSIRVYHNHVPPNYVRHNDVRHDHVRHNDVRHDHVRHNHVRHDHVRHDHVLFLVDISMQNTEELVQVKKEVFSGFPPSLISIHFAVDVIFHAIDCGF